MTQRPPEPLSDSELIAAYLDEDLSGADLARAEELFKTNAESRKLLDDLRAQRSMLADVPRERLGDEFAQRTMRKVERALRHAEREVLMPTAQSEELVAAAVRIPPLHVEASPDARVVPASRGWHLPRGRRPLVYAALALAAAVLLMLLPVRQGEPPTATVAYHESFPSSEIGSANRAAAAPAPSETMGVQGGGLGRSVQPSAPPASAAVSTSSPTVSKPLAVTGENIDNVQFPPGDDAEVRQVLTDAGLGSISDEVLVQTYALAREASVSNRAPVLLCPSVLVVEVDIKSSEWQRNELEAAFAENGIVMDASDRLVQNEPKVVPATSPAQANAAASNATRRPLDLMCVVAPDGAVNEAIEQWKDKRNVVVQTNVATPATPKPTSVQANQLGNRMVGRAQSLNMANVGPSVDLNLRKSQMADQNSKPAAADKEKASEATAKNSKQDGESQVPMYQRALLVIRAADDDAKSSNAASTPPAAAPATNDQ